MRAAGRLVDPADRVSYIKYISHEPRESDVINRSKA